MEFSGKQVIKVTPFDFKLERFLNVKKKPLEAVFNLFFKRWI